MVEHGGERGTILVVDDDPEILGMVSLRLGKRGYRVISAGDGQSAIDQARAEHPELIVLDVMLPGVSGWEVAKTLRDDPATESIKIVMLTAIGAQLNDMTSPLYGADAHLDKPFEFVALEGTIARLLS